MTRRIDSSRRKWVPLLLAFVLGLFVGWWVIGWWIWPVTYTNSLPQDMRADEKGNYLVMVADSYSATGDLATAQRRLETWPREQLARDLTALQNRLGQENPVQAEHVTRLTGALNLTAGQTTAAGQQPAGQAAAQPAPTARPVAAPAAQRSFFQQICPPALGIVAAIAGIAAIYWLWRQWQRRSGKPGTGLWTLPTLASLRRPSRPAAQRPDPIGADMGQSQEDRWEDVESPDWPGEATTWEAVDPVEDSFATGGAQVATPDPAPRPPHFLGSSAGTPVQRGAPAAGGAVASTGQLTKVGEYLAAYHSGEPDYDEAFDIKDTSSSVVGQCGLSLMMPVGRGSDQAAALQVWLWEEKDQYTQVKVLMSESAYKDTVLRDQLAEDNPAVAIRQGSEFGLETHRLLLYGTVEKLAFEERQEADRIFGYLAVRLKVYQKA